ncbi:DUF4177 domain-containing protein [Clostridium sp. UBA6640]|uniref:DUF4177 domain-containing protein n=1 Tax=Clostridium sp. UBA6640 TaxID=1946370 RepID=UPI0025BFF5E7|nr:DUF4177 domain-containing protein [Clostridium sp. UBA6640]
MKWEYKVIKIEEFQSLKDSTQLQQTLNNYGSEGWELIGILQQKDGGGWVSKPHTDMVTFKKQIEDY